MVRKLGIENKQLEFTCDIHNVQFNYLGKFYLKFTVISSFTNDYTNVHVRVNDGEDVERPEVLTSTVNQTDEETFHNMDDHKFTFTLPKGFCKNDTSHDVYLLVEAFEADQNERLNKKVGEAKFAVYPRTNAPRIDLTVEPGEFMLYYTDVMTLLKTTSAQDIKMHCGRIKYSVSLREVHAMPYMEPPQPMSAATTPYPRTARSPSPIHIPPPQPKRVSESPKLTERPDRGDLEDEEKNQTARSQAMILAKDSTNPAERTLDPEHHVAFPPASPSVRSEATMHLAPESPVGSSVANLRDLSDEAPDMFRHVARPNHDSFTIVFHGASSVPAVSDGSTPMPFAIAKTKSDLDEKNRVTTVTHCGPKPTHTPTWEEVVTLDVPNGQISDELLMLAVADKKSKEILVNYRLPVAHLVPFHHYHLELVMPAKGHSNGIRLYTTIIRKSYTIPMDSSSPNYCGFEVLLRAAQRPFANPVGPITAVARIVSDFPNYRRDMLDGNMKLAGITPTTIMFPSPHPNSFSVPPPVAQGYPQVTSPGTPDYQPVWNHPFLFCQKRDNATMFTPGAALVIEYYSARSVMTDMSWMVKNPVGFSTLLLDQNLYKELTDIDGRPGLRITNMPIQGTKIVTRHKKVPTVGLILRLLASERPDSLREYTQEDLEKFTLFAIPGVDPATSPPPVRVKKKPNYYIQYKLKKPYKPSQDDTEGNRLPPHHAVDSVLPEYQYIFMDQPHAEPNPSQKRNNKVPDLDQTHYGLLDQQMRELDRYRLAVQRMGGDIIQLRQTVRDLEGSNSMARRELGKYNDATRYMLDSSDLDGLNKPELAARYLTLKQTLSSQVNELAQYKERVQKLQNELIKKNEKEKEYLKVSNAHLTQQDLVQRLQEHVQRENDMSKAFKKQEEKLRMYEKAARRDKRGPDPIMEEDERPRHSSRKESSRRETELMDENSKLREEIQLLKIELNKPKKPTDKDEEKMELYEMLDRAEGRIMSLEKQLSENARKWGKEKTEMNNKLREAEMGLKPSSPAFSDYDLSKPRKDQLASSSRKLKPIVNY